MIVEYIGEDNPIGLLNGKEYEVIAVEKGWYRIEDESEEDYLYPPEVFKIIKE